MIWFLRVYLLAGLIAHKLLWVLLKRRSAGAALPQTQTSALASAAKLAKLVILTSIVVQTLVPDFLPISRTPTNLRVLGALIYTAGLLLALSARIKLGSNWADIEAAQVLSGQAVVDTGPYRYIRHPIYVGDLLLLLGLELALNSWCVLGMVLLTPIVLLQAIREEREVLSRLPGYDEYQRRTKRFVPFIA